MAVTLSSFGEPEWTEKAKKSGLDPLGMQTSGIALYQELVPGISNVTLRMRYYGFYAWLARSYAQQIGDTDQDRWLIFLRRAEALYALIAARAGGEAGVGGIEWAERALAAPDDLVLFHDATDRKEGHPQYLQGKFGSYGQAYGSQLIEVGVLFVGGKVHKVPVPTKVLGESLASAFESAVGAAGPEFLAAVEVGEVRKAQLDAWKGMLPSAILVDSAEWQAYVELLFPPDAPQGSRAESRNLSLRLTLHVASQRSALVKVDTVRWQLYAEQLGSATGVAPALSERERAHRFKWAAYHANDLLHVCYETVLKLCLDILSAAPNQRLPLDRLVNRAVERLQDSLSEPAPTTWREFCDGISPAQNPSNSADTASDRGLANSALQAGRPGASASEYAQRGALTLLAVLHRRLGGLVEEIASTCSVLASASHIRSLVTELPFLEAHADEPLQDLLARIVKQRVLDRHLWVATQKFRGTARDYTFLFEPDDGHVRFRAADGPILTNPRLAQGIAFLTDLQLLGSAGPTAAGKAILGEAA